MAESEQKRKEERRQELETIRIRQAADEIFRRNEEEKVSRKFDANRDLARFHLTQGVSGLISPLIVGENIFSHN